LSIENGLFRPRGIVTRVEAKRWDFAEEHKDEIETLWAAQIAKRPKMFNGIVLMEHCWWMEDGIHHARYAPVNFASFTSWVTLGRPGAPRRNGFSLGALRSIDGAFLLGVMGEHTYNGGKIYFPGGMPDMDDVRPDQTLDLAASAVREVMEETGLRRDELTASDNWTVVIDDFRAAYLRPITVHMPAEQARETILSRLKTETDGELSDIRIIRSLADLDDPKLAETTRAYIADAFANS
jgi:8-oxo-dGTP pyrophosphatase MutT (NUDIX family)